MIKHYLLGGSSGEDLNLILKKIFNIFNILFIIIDLKLVGCRIDEFDIRIPGLLKNIGAYDSFEIENKLTDHLLFSIFFTLLNILLYF